MPGVIDQLRKDISRYPLPVAGLALTTVALASLDYMEVAPATSSVTLSLPFQLLHSLHDLVFVSLSMFVAWRLSPALAGTLIGLFLLVSLPYHLIETPHDLPELTLALFANSAGIMGIGFLKKRRLAEQQAASPKNRGKIKRSRTNHRRKYIKRRPSQPAGAAEGIADCLSCINAEAVNEGVRCRLGNPRVSDHGCSQYGEGSLLKSGDKPEGHQSTTAP